MGLELANSKLPLPPLPMFEREKLFPSATFFLARSFTFTGLSLMSDRLYIPQLEIFKKKSKIPMQNKLVLTDLDKYILLIM